MFLTTTKLDATCHEQPRVSALLTCVDNIMPLSWHMPVSKSPLRYAICVRDENYSHHLLHRYKQFALNFLDFAYRNAYDVTGAVHGKGIDKFKLANLTPKKAHHIRTTLIEESYMIYECKVVDILNYGDHDIFIADILCIHNKEQESKPNATLFLGHGYYDTPTKQAKRAERKANL